MIDLDQTSRINVQAGPFGVRIYWRLARNPLKCNLKCGTSSHKARFSRVNKTDDLELANLPFVDTGCRRRNVWIATPRGMMEMYDEVSVVETTALSSVSVPMRSQSLKVRRSKPAAPRVTP